MKSLPMRRGPRAPQGQKPRAEPIGRMSAPRDGGDLREKCWTSHRKQIKSLSHFDLNLKLQDDLSYKQQSGIFSRPHCSQKYQKSNYPWNVLASYHMRGGQVSVSFISQCFPNSLISLTLSMIISWCSWFEWSTMLNSKCISLNLEPQSTWWDTGWETSETKVSGRNSRCSGMVNRTAHALNYLSFLSSLPKLYHWTCITYYMCKVKPMKISKILKPKKILERKQQTLSLGSP